MTVISTFYVSTHKSYMYINCIHCVSTYIFEKNIKSATPLLLKMTWIVTYLKKKSKH